ncbi:type II secretion system protein [Cryobacterium sp. TMT2-18-3]|uniref:type IV pilus modification PilV family protein n=1 Tax=Cryobacterium sp. TMT2-18-3 TaxID=1259250 RepID=UPI00106D8270|nr:type II secretion system protein [Cryobacterium sp. TMT2-18-3]TFC64589.1 type II secretion system protein [Cryobacterium sp. TMT2-18-3]
MKVLRTSVRFRDDPDTGLGLFEILVSMMILALLAVAVLPVLVQGLRSASNNATRATANQFAGQELDLVRTLSPNCTAVSAFDDGPSQVATDARGISLEIIRFVGACPAVTDYPGVVSVSVEIRNLGVPTPILAKATTLVLLEKAAP